jgi:hypothetical protein
VTSGARRWQGGVGGGGGALRIGQEGVTGMGGEGSARQHLNRGEEKMGTAGPAQRMEEE